MKLYGVWQDDGDGQPRRLTVRIPDLMGRISDDPVRIGQNSVKLAETLRRLQALERKE